MLLMETAGFNLERANRIRSELGMPSLEEAARELSIFEIKIPKSVQIEPEPWPLAIAPLKLLAISTDRGAGDIINRVIGPIGGNAFKVWFKRLFGKDCGCGHRQEVLNKRWPL